MAVLKAQKVPKKQVKVDNILARFCFYFPQYTFAQARKLPYKRVIQLLQAVDREHAKNMIDLVRIVAGPHSKDKGVMNKLLSEFKDRLS
jgi:hypothetical protein